MNTNKIIGYVLLSIGLITIFLTIFQSYNIFTAKSAVPLVFRTQLQSDKPDPTLNDAQKQINESIKQQIGRMISAENITKIFNLASWSFLAGILIIAGGTLASLGIKMVI